MFFLAYYLAKRIRCENERMSALISQLLELARTENVAPKAEALDLSRLACGEALPFESVAFEAGLSLCTQIEEGITLTGDADELRQLCSILLDNAIRHSPRGGRVELDLRAEKGWALLKVTNEGEAMPGHMRPDEYCRSSVRSIYYDTPNCRLIRSSIEDPAYKEKLRLRSYGRAAQDGTVFVELKKKYRKVVYKRRIALSQDEALGWLAGEHPCPRPGQIGAEIDYFLDFYRPLVPTVFLSSEREAYCSAEEPGFRLTFDERILCRRVDISLGSEACGTPRLPEGRVLMELKCTGGTFIGTGASGMAQSFSSSEQGVIAVSVGSQSAGTELTVTDAQGETLLSWSPGLDYNVFIYSSPQLVSGASYTVSAGTVSGETQAN